MCEANPDKAILIMLALNQAQKSFCFEVFFIKSKNLSKQNN
jgi:hypothetical protein